MGTLENLHHSHEISLPPELDKTQANAQIKAIKSASSVAAALPDLDDLLAGIDDVFSEAIDEDVLSGVESAEELLETSEAEILLGVGKYRAKAEQTQEGEQEYVAKAEQVEVETGVFVEGANQHEISYTREETNISRKNDSIHIEVASVQVIDNSKAIIEQVQVIDIDINKNVTLISARKVSVDILKEKTGANEVAIVKEYKIYVPSANSHFKLGEKIKVKGEDGQVRELTVCHLSEESMRHLTTGIFDFIAAQTGKTVERKERRVEGEHRGVIQVRHRPHEVFILAEREVKQTGDSPDLVKKEKMSESPTDINSTELDKDEAAKRIRSEQQKDEAAQVKRLFFQAKDEMRFLRNQSDLIRQHAMCVITKQDIVRFLRGNTAKG